MAKHARQAANQCIGAIRIAGRDTPAPAEVVDVARAWLATHARKLTPIFRLALRDESAGVREYAAELLGQYGRIEDVPLLIEALSDDCMFVRQDAGWAIARIAGVDLGTLMEQVPEMFDVADDGTRARRAARRWWRRRGKAKPKTARQPPSSSSRGHSCRPRGHARR